MQLQYDACKKPKFEFGDAQHRRLTFFYIVLSSYTKPPIGRVTTCGWLSCYLGTLVAHTQKFSWPSEHPSTIHWIHNDQERCLTFFGYRSWRNQQLSQQKAYLHRIWSKRPLDIRTIPIDEERNHKKLYWRGQYDL